MFCSERLQSRLFHKTLKRLRKIEAWIDGPVEPKEAVGRHILVHAGMKWRLLSMGDMSLKRARKFITIEGLEILEKYRDQQTRIVLINSHFGAYRVVSKILCQSGFPLTIVTGQSFGSKLANYECPLLLTGELLPTQIIRESTRAIETNRILCISADGREGNSGIEHNFLGKKRVFRTGFAQLAIKTKAPVIPVFSTVDEYGKVHIKLHAPLDSGDSTQTKSDRIYALVQQYVKLLEGYWIADPGNIRMGQFRLLLKDDENLTTRQADSEESSRAA